MFIFKLCVLALVLALPVLAQPTVPGAPTNVKGAVTDVQTGRISISWEAPVSDGGSPITGYTVTNNGSAFCATTTATSCMNFTTSAIQHTMIVKASNAVGMGQGTTIILMEPDAIKVRLLGATYILTASSFRIPSEDLKTLSQVAVALTDMRGRSVWSRAIHPASDGVREVAWTPSNGFEATGGVFVLRVTLTKRDGRVEHFTRKITVADAF